MNVELVNTTPVADPKLPGRFLMWWLENRFSFLLKVCSISKGEGVVTVGFNYTNQMKRSVELVEAQFKIRLSKGLRPLRFESQAFAEQTILAPGETCQQSVRVLPVHVSGPLQDTLGVEIDPRGFPLVLWDPGLAKMRLKVRTGPRWTSWPRCTDWKDCTKAMTSVKWSRP